MIQDIAPHTYHNEYKPSAPDKNSFILAYEKGRILLPQQKREEAITFPNFQELEGKIDDLYTNYIYLFSVDEQRFYLIPDLDTSLLPDYEFQDVRVLRTAHPQHLAFAGITGHQLFQWYNKRQYCGFCGKPMVHSQKERMMECPSCGNHEYPVLCPAVIVGITNGDKIILSKYEGRRFKRYALIAGFAEIGETIEETVHREVMEEVGLKVKNITYYKSQPWSFTDTLLMGFFCKLDGEAEITLDKEELALAEWFEREDIPVKAEDLSLTNEMMMVFKEGKI